MIRLLSRWMLAVLTMVPFGMARASTVHGTVKNATTGQNAAGIELALLQPMSGMQEVAHSKSGSQGEFTFDHPGLGTQPMLVQAIYQGIHFNQMVPPGRDVVEVDIYEPSKDLSIIQVPSHVVVLQPTGATMIVGEEYQVENKSQPPRAYYRKEGNFEFALPEKAKLQQVAAVGTAGMPLPQVPIDKKNRRYSIAFAFHPGQSTVRYSYELPYPAESAVLKIPTIYPGGRLLVVAPPSMQVRGDGLQAAGQEQGMSLYTREDVPAGTLVTVNVSGTAPPPSANGGGGEPGPSQGRDAQQGGNDAGSNIEAVPGRLDVLKWPLILGFVIVFAFFGYLLNRKKVVVASGPEHEEEEAPKAKKPKKTAPVAASPSVPPPSALASTPAPPEAATKAPSNGTATMKEVDAAVGTSLDALKERLFRLELRRQAGTISDEEYATERARAEKVLRDLVRG